MYFSIFSSILIFCSTWCNGHVVCMSLWTPSKLSGHSARRRAHNCTNGKSYKCANLQLYFCANKKSYKSANELCNCTNLHLCAVCNYIVLHFGHFLSSIGQLILHSNMHTKSLAATQLEKQLTKRGQALYKCEWMYKGRCHLRFSGIRPLRGSPPPLNGKSVWKKEGFFP